MPNELRRWGYVIWGAHRIDVHGTKEYLKDLWASSPEVMLVCRHWAWIWMSDIPKLSADPPQQLRIVDLRLYGLFRWNLSSFLTACLEQRHACARVRIQVTCILLKKTFGTAFQLCEGCQY